MTTSTLHLLLADDDTDDCIFFREALEELPVCATLTTVNDGVQLMQRLTDSNAPVPNALFLDLNMPRKSGIECLSEIKIIDKFNNLPVIIYSTSLNAEVVDLLYKKGAHYYIRKPGEFYKLKKIIFKAVKLISQNKITRPSLENFILEP